MLPLGDEVRRQPAKEVDSSRYHGDRDVGVGPNDAGSFKLDIELRITLPGIDPAETQTLVETAHKVCPYSNATRNNVDVCVKLV